MQLLLDGRVKRACFLLWCLGWLVVAWFSLGQATTIGSMSDKMMHFVGYAAMAAGTATFRHDVPGVLALGVVAVAAGGVVEVVQMLLPWRSADWADLAANAMGAVVGSTIALIWLGAVLRPLRRAAA